MIIRIDSKSTHGWQARAYTKAPKYVSKLFSDAKHGGSVAAYRMAEREVRRLRRVAGNVRAKPPSAAQEKQR